MYIKRPLWTKPLVWSKPRQHRRHIHLQPLDWLVCTEERCGTRLLGGAADHDCAGNSRSTPKEHCNSFPDNICHGGSVCCPSLVAQDTLRGLFCSKILTAGALCVVWFIALAPHNVRNNWPCDPPPRDSLTSKQSVSRDRWKMVWSSGAFVSPRSSDTVFRSRPISQHTADSGNRPYWKSRWAKRIMSRCVSA